MKLPSISYLVEESSKTFIRFPVALVNASVGTVAALIIAEREAARTDQTLMNIVLTTVLGISFLTTLVVFAEKQKWKPGSRVVGQLIGAVALGGYFLLLPSDIETAPNFHMIRFGILLTAMHLLTAFAPFAGKAEPNGFWQYNKIFFLRILTAILYSGVLFAGLAVALGALDQLFGVDIGFKRYAQLWIVIMGLFNTWFFLAGIPKDLDLLNLETSYPKGLKIFTQYILMPLVVIYLMILYAYMGKIAIQQELPQGWVSKLVLGFSVTGILALLLVHPIKEQSENVWIRTVSKWYYLVLVPLDGMLVLAVWRRISEYGITENRYIVAMLGIWLTSITIYFIFSKSKNIKVIPTSLCIIGFLSAFGPWSAFSISAVSQLGRLELLLKKNDILEHGIVRRASVQPSNHDSREISSIVRYLVETHGLRSVQRLFDVNLDTLAKRHTDSLHVNVPSQKPEWIVEMMGLRYYPLWGGDGVSPGLVNFSSVETRIVDVGGFDKLAHISTYALFDSMTVPLRENLTCLVRTDVENLRLTFLVSGAVHDSLLMDLRPMIERLKKDYGSTNYKSNIPRDQMTEQCEDSVLRVMLSIRIVAQSGNKETAGNSLQGDLLIGLKR